MATKNYGGIWYSQYVPLIEVAAEKFPNNSFESYEDDTNQCTRGSIEHAATGSAHDVHGWKNVL